MGANGTALDEVIIATLDEYGQDEGFRDNVTKNVSLLRELKKADNIVKYAGGASIREPLSYAENTTFKWYRGSETLNVNQAVVLGYAEFNWKYCNVNVIVTGEDQYTNAGEYAIQDLVMSKVNNAQATMTNQLGLGSFADGTGSAGKEMGGLKLIVADAPSTGTVGGIDRSATASTFWRNQVVNPATTSSADLIAAMEEMDLLTQRMGDRCNLIIMGKTYYKRFKAGTTYTQNTDNSTSTMQISAKNAEFAGIPVIYDYNCGDERAYFLNTKYLKLKVHANRFMKVEKEKMFVNQDSKVIPVFSMLNLTCSNCSLQGVVKPA